MVQNRKGEKGIFVESKIIFEKESFLKNRCPFLLLHMIEILMVIRRGQKGERSKISDHGNQDNDMGTPCAGID
ncbi:hypothetical protein AS888_21785 [Peribacillus simplex]|uniref:Uncharacterized protein n=1 Tax=Peribacillus simplex TaxID=1478 RepID=A0A109MX57_9BACI|nr:hypothetical protein AS888_21785 [Peribacillus simplex]